MVVGWLLLFLAALAPSVASASDFEATVKKIIDGDSLVVIDSLGLAREIRLHEIDAPEYGQPWSRRARSALRDILGKGAVTVVPVTIDRYGRTVAKIKAQSVDVSREMVRRGYAWVYRQYLLDRSLLDVEKAAKNDGRGLWSDPASHRIPPWTWRRSAGKSKPAPNETAPVIGNRRTWVYHLPAGCPGYTQVSRPNRRRFTTEALAKAAGFRLARNCKSRLAQMPSAAQGPVRGNRSSRIYHWSGCPGFTKIGAGNRIDFADAATAVSKGYRAARNCR